MESLLYNDFDGLQAENAKERPIRNDKYVYEKFKETSAPDLAVEARRVHAEGYKSMGFVHENAFAIDGTLADDIDKARGNLVEYYAGINIDKQDNSRQGVAVTLRKIGIRSGGSIDDLPAYKLCAETFYEGEKEKLAAIENPHLYVKEIGALARTEGTNPIATLELIRNVFQEAWASKTGQTWLLSIVTTTFDAFEDNFGGIAIRRIGDEVDLNDERVGEQVKLIPAVVDVDNFLDNIITSMEQDENRSHRTRMMRSVLFFSEGLRDDEMSDSVRSLRQEYKARFESRQNGVAA